MNERDTYRSQFAAYFAGQLPAEESALVEQAFARDAELSSEAEALRPVAERLDRDLGESPADFRLSADRLAFIRAAASHHIIEFPAARIVRPPK